MEEHTGGFCIKSVKAEPVNVDVPATQNFDFGEALARVYPLLELVFSYLNSKDLISCAEVSPSWQDVTNKILQKRTAPSWFTCYKVTPEDNKEVKENILEYSPNLNYNDVGMGIILYDSTRIKLNKYICVHSNTSELSRKTFSEYFEEEFIPLKLDYCLLSVPRVVSLFNTKQSLLPKKFGSGSVFDGVFIPNIPHLRSSIFHCNSGKKKEIKETVKSYIKPDEEIKCLFLFSMKQLHNKLYDLLHYIVPKNNPTSMALAGGVICGKSFQQINVRKNVHTRRDVICIALLKTSKTHDDNFNSFSCVINGNDLTRDEYDKQLSEFKEKIVLRKHNIGFRICCAAKYEKESEMHSFQKIFPNIPLLGLDAQGEFGWNCFGVPVDEQNNESDEPPKAKRRKSARIYPDAYHEWSSIFLILTWN